MILPVGVYIYHDRVCPDCGKAVVRFGDIEGLKLYACPDRCRIDRSDPAFRKPGDDRTKKGRNSL